MRIDAELEAQLYQAEVALMGLKADAARVRALGGPDLGVTDELIQEVESFLVACRAAADRGRRWSGTQ